MSLLSSLYVGASGLQSSQNAVNTTANNLANVDTEGYTRQQVSFASSTYTTLSTSYKSVSNQQTGLGVYYSETRQVRDYFLDQTYREENGRLSFYNVTYSTFCDVEDLLGELSGETFSDALTNLWESVQELAKDPSSSVTMGLFIQRAYQFVTRAVNVYSDLCDYQDNLNSQITSNISRVNEIAERIYELNNSILAIESGGVENANDLRDERNLLMDELSGLINIDYYEDVDGNFIVKAEGHSLVSRNAVYTISLYTDPTTGFYTPYWETDASYTTNADGSRTLNNLSQCQVYDLTRTISTEADTDIGSIKAILLARGDKRATYADMDEDTYNSTISQSVIMNVQAELDKMINAIVTQINAVIAAAADPETGYLCDDDGNPIQIFQKIMSDGYDEDGNYIEEDPDDKTTLYTLSNLQINSALLQDSSLLGFVLADGTVDYETAEALMSVFSTESYTLNPNVTNECSLLDFYSNMVSQVANSASVFGSVYENQVVTVDSVEYSRQMVVGVSDDEELTNLIKYQNGYNAASRFINVVDECLEHLINKLGG